ncbi:MAG: hypothetical protein AB1452_10890 [Pseudomonadota bacterium]
MSDAPEANRIAFEEREIEAFERLAYGRQHEPAARRLIEILDRAYRIYRTPGRLVPPSVERRLYTRLAAAACALLADPRFQLSEDGFASLALHHSTLGYLFSASGFGRSNHLAALAGARNPDDPKRLDYRSPQEQRKLLLACSLDSTLEVDLEAMLRADPQGMLPLYLGMLNRYLFLTPAAHQRREMLLGIAPLFQDTVLSPRQLPSLAVAWMNCMYATGRDKHAIKRTLNRLLARFVGDAPAAAPRQRRPLAARPVMLVPIEDLREGHVNYRTFGPLLRGLRERFELVGAHTGGRLDAGSASLFDRVLDLEHPVDRGGYARVIAQLRGVNADIAYYPTVGSNPWCIVTATQRLAPIQVATMGVPATTHSEAMDYVVIEESWAGDPACYSETLVETRAGSTRFLPREWSAGSRPAAPRAPSANDLVRIAVPALGPKLTMPFMQACGRIAERSSVPLEWHFFAGLSGLQHAVARDQIKRLVPDAIVHPYLDYDSYMRALARCDLHLSTFPFGGMNTIFDSLYLGLPIVTFEGREPHERSDAGMMRRAALPEWLIAHDEEEYVRIALRLTGEPQLRHEVCSALLETDIEKAFFTDGRGPEDDFVAAFAWIYEQHEALQHTAKRAWTVQHRQETVTRGSVASQIGLHPHARSRPIG